MKMSNTRVITTCRPKQKYIWGEGVKAWTLGLLVPLGCSRVLKALEASSQAALS